MEGGQDVAVKVLAERAAGDSGQAGFENAMRRVAGVAHPALVRILDVGFIQDRRPVIIMELLSGGDLRALLNESPQNLRVERVVSIGAPVAEALAYAHKRKVLHRALQPGDIFIARTGVKVLNLGLVEAVMALQPGASEAYYTPAYAAPEVWLDEPAQASADLYSLGCILYEMLRGTPPFSRSGLARPSDELRRRHLSEKPAAPSISTTAEGLLWQTVLDLLAKNPGNRPTASQTVERLRIVRRNL
jgi:serine/threonine protein kinase